MEDGGVEGVREGGRWRLIEMEREVVERKGKRVGGRDEWKGREGERDG